MKAFTLRRAVGEQARIHSDGEWQLRFRDGSARDFAHRRFALEKWLCHKTAPDDEILYTFLNDGADLSAVLAALETAGIPRAEIEVEPAAQNRVMARLVDQRGRHIPRKTDSTKAGK